MRHARVLANAGNKQSRTLVFPANESTSGASVPLDDTNEPCALAPIEAQATPAGTTAEVPIKTEEDDIAPDSDEDAFSPSQTHGSGEEEFIGTKPHVRVSVRKFTR